MINVCLFCLHFGTKKYSVFAYILGQREYIIKIVYEHVKLVYVCMLICSSVETLFEQTWSFVLSRSLVLKIPCL